VGEGERGERERMEKGGGEERRSAGKAVNFVGKCSHPTPT
jgi:hypothetical protein